MTASAVRLLPLAVAVAALGGCLADLRPEPLAERASPRDPERARAILERAAAAQVGSGRPAWRELPGVRAELTDAFHGLVGAVACPWPEDPQELRVRFRPAADDAVIAFRDADGGERRWGVHDWNAWVEEPGEPPRYADDEDVLFWVPTLVYFLELPFRLPEATVVDYGGEAEVDGAPCDVVYATWSSYGPVDAVDQYVAYCRREDGLLVRADFTVRDVADFVTAAVRYADFREAGGYLLPHEITIGDPPEDPLHVYTVERWEPGVPLADEELGPEPGRAPREKPGP